MPTADLQAITAASRLATLTTKVAQILDNPTAHAPSGPERGVLERRLHAFDAAGDDLWIAARQGEPPMIGIHDRVNSKAGLL